MTMVGAIEVMSRGVVQIKIVMTDPGTVPERKETSLKDPKEGTRKIETE